MKRDRISSMVIGLLAASAALSAGCKGEDFRSSSSSGATGGSGGAADGAGGSAGEGEGEGGSGGSGGGGETGATVAGTGGGGVMKECVSDADCMLDGAVCVDDKCGCAAATDTLCAGVGCVDTQVASTDCGACGNACPPAPHAEPACSAGSCALTCEAGFADCDGDPGNGCEVDTSTDDANCGACGNACFLHCAASACNDPIDVAAGYRHTCAVLHDGSVWCWGANLSAEVDSSLAQKPTPTKVALAGPATQVVAGGGAEDNADHAHSCALLAAGTVQCWGDNDYGQLGTGNKVMAWNPVALSLTGVKALTAGALHTCALKTSGELFCWGHNKYGFVGDGTTVDQTVPTLVDTSVSQAAAGMIHTCDLHANGQVYCWGGNYQGQLGIGAQPTQTTTPTLVPSLSAVDQVAAGGFQSCARSVAGVFCWGTGAYQAAQKTPASVGISTSTFLEMGTSHLGAVDGGDVWMWGANSYGQLGNGSTSNLAPPAKIGMSSVTRISLGDGHSCAITGSGSLLCWGLNNGAQLGDGTTAAHSSPMPVMWQ